MLSKVFRTLVQSTSKSLHLSNRAWASSEKYFKTEGLEEISIITKNYPGSLQHVLDVFKTNKINLCHLDTRLLNKQSNGLQNCAFIVTAEGSRKEDRFKHLFNDLNGRFDNVSYQDHYKEVHWYPRHDEEVKMAGKSLLIPKDAGENNADHPSLSDPEYRKRREYIGELAKTHVFGKPIATMEYTDEEQDCWRQIYAKLNPMIDELCTSRCKKLITDLENQLEIDKKIPQLKDLDAYINEKTGFRIKPAHGIMSQRDFLNLLGHRVFSSTQYIRHPSTPEYTPEPDIVHEIVGHVPQFADPLIADISQEIGLMSLGASTEQVAALGSLYWYTIEFGACKENGQMKFYGAGIASSIGEMENFKSGKADFKLFDPNFCATHPFPVQTVQPTYFYNDTFEQCLNSLVQYGNDLLKPMRCYYDNKEKVVKTDRKVEAIFKKEHTIDF